MAIEIVDLLIDSMVIFHSFLYVYQRVTSQNGDLLGLLTTYYSWDVILQVVENSRETERFVWNMVLNPMGNIITITVTLKLSFGGIPHFQTPT